MHKTWSQYYSNTVFNIDRFIEHIHVHEPIISEILNGSRPENIKVLETGAGTGYLSLFLSFLGCDISILDNDKDILAKAKNLLDSFNRKATFYEGDVFQLDKAVKDEHFDVIFSQGLFEHFGDEEIKDLIHKQLKHGDKIIISVPSAHYGIQEFGDERLLSVADWCKILSSFKTSKIYGYHFLQKSLKTIIKRAVQGNDSLFPLSKYQQLLIIVDK